MSGPRTSVCRTSAPFSLSFDLLLGFSKKFIFGDISPCHMLEKFEKEEGNKAKMWNRV
jgi:hypothetical protein